MQTLITVKNAYRLSLKLAGILFTMADEETKYSQEIIRVARRRLGDRIFATLIPRDKQLQESPVLERPLVVQDIFSKGAQSYTVLATEIIERNKRIEL
jgi:chromosome partitioning protein